jgi:hypothetical protein
VTTLPCCCHTSPHNTAQSQLALSSGFVQLIVPHQRLIIMSERLSAPRCMMSKPADLGNPNVLEQFMPENIEGLDIPVSRYQE